MVPRVLRTFLISHATEEGQPQLYLTAMYEIWVNDLKSGTKIATKMETDYSALAKKACSDAVKDIREWKLEGKLKEWADGIE